MRALVKEHPGPGLTLVERDRPEPGPGEALLHVALTGLCGTDLAIQEWRSWIPGRILLPVVVGHEGVALVEAVGPHVARVSTGDRVGIESHVPCGSCRNCLGGRLHLCLALGYLGQHIDGLFAEYAVVPEELLFPLPGPDELPDDVAVLLEPLGLAVRAATGGTGVAGKAVLVTGLGPLGAMACLAARRFGASRVLASEVAAYRLAYARTHASAIGIDRVIDGADEDVAAVVRDATGGDGADVWIDFAGGPAFADGLDALRAGGEAHLFAPVETPTVLTPLIMKEIAAYGLHGRLIYETWFDAVETGIELREALAALVTHSLPLDDYQRAFELARSGETMKVVLEP